MSIQAFAQRKTVFLRGHLTPAHFSFFNKLPGFKKFNEKGAQFAATRIHLELYNSTFPDNPIEDADGTVADALRPIPPIVEHERLTVSNIPLFDHQRVALNKALSRETYGFFHEMGTGKTATQIHIAAELAARGVIDRAVIVAPKRVVPQTVEIQIPEHMPAGVRYSAAAFPSPKAIKQLARAKADGAQLLIAVVGYGMLRSDGAALKVLQFVKEGPCVVLVDESHNIKNHNTNTARNLEAMRPYMQHRYLFTGTPDPNGPIDLYGQFRFMDPNILGHASLTSFKNQFCVLGGYEGREIVDYRNLDELSKAIADHCEFVKIADVQDMPEQQYEIRTLAPEADQRRIYNTLKNDFVIAITQANASGDQEVRTKLAKNAAAKLVAMQQVAAGFFYEDGPEEGVRGPLVVLNDNRADYLVEDVIGAGDHGPKVIVFCRFHGSLDSVGRACKAAGVPFVEFSGRRSDEENAAALAAFKQDPKVRVFNTTAAAGGTGLNLQHAHHAVFFENGYNLAHRLQAEARIWRVGQKNHCVYTDLVVFPIDKMVISALRKKTDLAHEIEQRVSLASLTLMASMI